MINPLLRRSVLASMAVASLSFPAGARSDAAFAAALGKPLPGLAAMARLKIQSQIQSQIPAAAQAQVSGPAAPADVWKKILDTVRRDGVKGGDKQSRRN